jgi:hypothetical protein
MLTFEGSKVQGPEAIIAKMKSVGPVKHTVKVSHEFMILQLITTRGPLGSDGRYQCAQKAIGRCKITF